MTESDAGRAAVDKHKVRSPVDEQTQSETEDVRPGDEHTPQGRLAGPRSDEEAVDRGDQDTARAADQ